MNTKDSLKEYYIKLHDLYNNAVNILTAVNQSLSTTASEVTVDILDTDSKLITKFFDTKSSYEYHTTLTNQEHSNGIINMVVLDKSVTDGVEGRGVEFTYNISTKEIKINKMTTVGGHD